MSAYNNPRVYLANLVKFEYDKEEKKYVPLILNAKIPVVLILGSGYFTEPNNVFNNKYSMPLNLVDLNAYGKVKTYKYYITNATPLSRYTEDENAFLANLNLNLLKLNNLLNCDGNWYKKEDIKLDRGLILGKINQSDTKIRDDLYIARMVSKVKKFQNIEGYFSKDEYAHISKNYGLFTYDKGWFKSILTGYEFQELTRDDLRELVMSFEIDRAYSSFPITSREEIGLYDIDTLRNFCASNCLYIDSSSDILGQINSYKGLENPVDLRFMSDLKHLDKRLELPKQKQEELNKEIMLRTLHK